MFYKRDDYFYIGNIFIFLTIYFLIIPFILSEFDLRVMLALPVFFIGFLSFFLGLKTKKYFKIKSASYESMCLHKRTNFALLIMSLFLLFVDIYHAIFIILNPVENNLNYTSRYFLDNDYSSLYVQILTLTFLYIKFYLYALLMSRSKSYYYLIFIIQVVLYSTSQVRLVALSPLIIFIIYGFYMGYIKISLPRVLVLLLLSPVLFLILLMSRGKAEGVRYFFNYEHLNMLFSETNLPALFYTSMESFLSFEYLLRVINDGMFFIESGIIRIFFMPISRDYWMDKPEAFSRIIAKNYNIDQYDSGGGSVATIYGDAFLNGHVIGVVLVMFAVGYFSKVVYNTVFSNLYVNKEQKSMLLILYSIFIYQFLFYFRGFLSESYWKFILLIFVFIVLYSTQRILFRLLR